MTLGSVSDPSRSRSRRACDDGDGRPPGDGARGGRRGRYRHITALPRHHRGRAEEHDAGPTRPDSR